MTTPSLLMESLSMLVVEETVLRASVGKERTVMESVVFTGIVGASGLNEVVVLAVLGPAIGSVSVRSNGCPVSST